MLLRILAFLSALALVAWLVFQISVNFLPARLPAGQAGLLSAVVSSTLVELSNENRRGQNLSALKQSPALSEAARLKAADMVLRGYFSHKDLEGNPPWHWFDKVGYEYKYAGENLALNFSESKEVMQAWLGSPAHRANILNSKYQEIGIGIAEGTYQGQKAIFIVQFFATPTKAQAVKKIPEYGRIMGSIIEAGLWPFREMLERNILEKLLGDSFGQPVIILSN